MKLKRLSTILAVAAAAALTASAAPREARWLRDAAISPDGTRIAFTYKGDIYVVGAKGGQARQLTTNSAYEQTPVWSPDGLKIAFASSRNGGADIYVMEAAGGEAKRLTSNSAIETPMAFSPDGTELYFAASIQDPAASILFPSARLTEVYAVPVQGGRIRQVIGSTAEMISFDGTDGSFIYQDRKGIENDWRKHHTSSVTRDIWRYDAKSGRHTNLTRHAGEDRNPVVGADGATVYFLSERDGGSMNVYSLDKNNPSAVKQLTDFKEHPVRFLSQADNGLIAMTFDGDLYTLQPGATPVKVPVTVNADYDEAPRTINFSNGVDFAAVSPDGKQVAIVYRGDVFVASVDHSSIKQITRTPAPEAHVAWSTDGNTLYYTSERDGHTNIYSARRANDSDPNFSNATIIEETALFDPADNVERARPVISPDGKKMAFIEDRNKVMIMDLASKAVKQLTDGSKNPSRDTDFTPVWAPDSRWIAMDIISRGHEPYYDVAIFDTETGEMLNITDTGYFDLNPHWVFDGEAIIFLSERYGMRNHASWGSQNDVMITFLTRDAYDRFILSEEDYELKKEVEKANAPKKDDNAKKDSKKKDKKGKEGDEEKAPKEIKIDRKGLQDRTIRLTPNSSDLSDAIVTSDGKSLYYLAAFEGGYDLWKADLRGDDVALVKKLDDGGSFFEMLPDGTIFLVGNKIRKLNTSNDNLTAVNYSGKMTFDPAQEREAMLQFVRNEERERFYEEAMHGVKWDALVDHYAEFLPHITDNYEYSEMLSELLGELNVSHTGSGYSGPGPKEPTASFGLLYDLTKREDGLRVTEVLEFGPFDRADSKMVAGAIINAINGEPIKADSDYTALFNGIAGKKTLVAFTTPDGASHQEVILPENGGKTSEALYRRWVKSREAYVDSISGGRLGYVHLRSMGDPSFRSAYADVLGKFNDREGIVIDTRWNGGGRLHEDIEILFSGQKYLSQEIRGRQTCDMPSRRWNKPSIMVQCEANYSNAHGTPWVYKHQGLGKLVGAPVPGTMTSVNWVTLQDPSLYFGIPVIGYRLADGTVLENQQLEPDILVLNDPADAVAGRDDQLRVAVEELLKDIDAKK